MVRELAYSYMFSYFVVVVFLRELLPNLAPHLLRYGVLSEVLAVFLLVGFGVGEIMLTKRELCEHIVETKGRSHTSISQSSTLAVALEFLGLLITDEEKAYTGDRGGIVYITGEGKVLSFRELLDLLPDRI